MHKLSFGAAFHAGRLLKLLTIAALAVPVALECPGATACALPAPTLHVFPGETLIIHFENGLTGLTIRDYFSPQYTPNSQSVPIYPQPMTSSPINLHTHGAHISPRGNADNVLLHIPPGMCNTYTYDIPRNMPQGLYGITVIFMGSLRPTSIQVSLDCWRSDERTATCRL